LHTQSLPEEEATVERKLITCPGSAHLEEIEMERTPFGIVIVSCSRFTPACEVTCARDCAARMDRRDRLRATEMRERVLIVYADDATHRLAEQLAPMLVQDDFVVELADASTRAMPPPQDYEAVVVVAPVHRRRLARGTADYVTDHHDALMEMPSFFVPISARSDDDLSAGESLGTIVSTGWVPTYSEAVSVHAPASSHLATRIRAIATRIAEEIPSLQSR
jgi:hypothetical protein